MKNKYKYFYNRVCEAGDNIQEWLNIEAELKAYRATIPKDQESEYYRTFGFLGEHIFMVLNSVEGHDQNKDNK